MNLRKNTVVMLFKTPTPLLSAVAAIIGLMISAATLSAQSFSGTTNGLNYSSDGTTVTIGRSSVTGDFTIPASINGKPVTKIGANGFNGCYGLTSLIIPNSVTNIEWNAFQDCSALTSITIPDSVTSIGINAFYGTVGITAFNVSQSMLFYLEKYAYGLVITGTSLTTIQNESTAVRSYGYIANWLPGDTNFLGTLASGLQLPSLSNALATQFSPTNPTFSAGIATNPTFLATFSNQIAAAPNNLGIATKGDITSITMATAGLSNSVSGISNALATSIAFQVTWLSNALGNQTAEVSNTLAASIDSQVRGLSNSFNSALESQVTGLSNTLWNQATLTSNSLAASMYEQGASFSNAMSNAQASINGVSNSLGSVIASNTMILSNSLSGVSNTLVASLSIATNTLNRSITGQVAEMSNTLSSSIAAQGASLSIAVSNALSQANAQALAFSNSIASLATQQSTLASSLNNTVSPNQMQTLGASLSNAITSLAAQTDPGNASFASALVTNRAFITALATNSAFLAALSQGLAGSTNNYGFYQKQLQTLTFPAIAPVAYSYGKSVKLAVTSSAKLTPVTYTSSNDGIASVSNNALTITGAGTVTITASQAGNLTTAPATATQVFVVTPVVQTLKFGSIPAQTYAVGKTVTLNATSSAKLSPVTYTSSNEGVATVSGNVLTLVGPGTSVITATQAGDGNNTSASAVQILTVK